MAFNMVMAFLDETPKAWLASEKIDKLDFSKIRSFHSVRNNAKGMRRQDTNWEKIFSKNTFDQGQYPKYTKNS